MPLFEDIESQITIAYQTKQAIKIKLSDRREFYLDKDFLLNKKSIQGWDKITQQDSPEIPISMIVGIEIN